jgi:hypothetical protein
MKSQPAPQASVKLCLAFLIAGLLLVLPAIAQKKPKPPLPSACVKDVCIMGLRWEQDYSEGSSGSIAVAIFGTLDSHSEQTIERVAVTFSLLNSSNTIVRTVRAYLRDAPIARGSRWDFKIQTGTRGSFQIVADDVLVTTSAALEYSVRSGDQSQQVRDQFSFDPVFNKWGYGKKTWLQNH